MDSLKRSFLLRMSATVPIGSSLVLAFWMQSVARSFGQTVPAGLASSAAKKELTPVLAWKKEFGPAVDPDLLAELETDYVWSSIKRVFKGAELIVLHPEQP